MGVRKVAICGLAPSYQLAPWFDDEWEKWSLAWGHQFIHWSQKVFEMHNPVCFGEGYEEHLAEIENLVTQENYPLDEIISRFRDYFGSSGDYMFALAAHELEKGDQVAIYGINAADKDYAHQRQSMEYWLACIEMKTGNKIMMPDDCPLLKWVKPDFIEHPWNKRYGYC